LLDIACFAAGRRGREVRRVDGNPHYPSYDPKACDIANQLIRVDLCRKGEWL